MNFLEALQASRIKMNPNTGEEYSELWFRPVSYTKWGMAFCVSAGRICTVPSARGAQPTTFNSKILMEEWEVVSPDKVNNERARQ